jgi:hypothetical protein
VTIKTNNKGEGEKWVRGLGGCYMYETTLYHYVENVLRHGFRTRLKCHSLQSNSNGFRNRLKCHLFQSIIYNFVVTYSSKCHRLSLSLLAVNEITLIGRPFSQSWLFDADVSQNEQNAALVLQSVRRNL